MPNTKNRRWLCPERKHPGVLAPGRLRKDDIRRFCLPCSQKTGRLVERLCPALDKTRKEREAKKRQKAQRKRASVAKAKKTRERNAKAKQRVTIAGVEIDLLEQAERFWKLPAMKEARERYAAEEASPIGKPYVPFPEISLRSSTRLTKADAARGRAWSCVGYRGRVSLTLGPDRNGLAALETLLHELVHCSVGNHHNHDKVFRRCLVQAAEQAFGVTCSADLDSRKSYTTDWMLEIAMHDALKAGQLRIGARKKLPRSEGTAYAGWRKRREAWLGL